MFAAPAEAFGRRVGEPGPHLHPDSELRFEQLERMYGVGHTHPFPKPRRKGTGENRTVLVQLRPGAAGSSL
jgi:hypothetical protein